MSITYKSPHIPAFMGDPIDSAAASIGIPADQLRMVVALLAAIPLGEFHKLLPNATVKHIYSASLGMFFCYFLVGEGCIHQFISTFIVYIMCRTLDKKSMPAWVFAFSLAYLSGSHIYRTIYDYLGWSLDYTMIQMIWCVKSVTVAYNYADGQYLNEGKRLHEKDNIHNQREARALRKFPSLLEFFSYSFFYGAVLVGPAFEITDYLKFQDLSLFKQEGLTSIPHTLLPALLRVFYALLSYGGVFLGSFFPAGEFVISSEFKSYSFLYKIMYSFVAAFCIRCKYYFAWYLAEAGCIASGLGFNGVVKKEKGEIVGYKWDRCSNVNAVGVESGISFPHLTNNWNLGVNNWLKNYVYFRVMDSKSLPKALPVKSVANIITKSTAAFWHGFYPPYYSMFLTAWLINEMDDARHAAFDRIFFKLDSNGKQIPRSSFYNLLYSLIGWVLVFIPMNQLGIAFNLQRLDWSIEFWKSCYFIPFLLPVIVIVVSMLFKPKRKREDKNKTPTTNGVTPLDTNKADNKKAA